MDTDEHRLEPQTLEDRGEKIATGLRRSCAILHLPSSILVRHLCASVSICGSVVSFASFSFVSFVPHHLRKGA
jgi:hypothetical protein